ncbi:MAG: hypothetical protein WA057_06095, partial [Candidatus Magasanikiibacteriota bacterium]
LVTLSQHDDYLRRGLNAEEAAELVQIERIERLGSVYVQLSKKEIGRKKDLLKKLKNLEKE